jgi:ketosteroid isomerase-like protein
LAWTGVHGADVPVGAHARADTIVGADGRAVAAFVFQAQGQEEKETGQEVASEGQEETGEKEEGREKETPPLTHLATTSAGASRRDAPATRLKEKTPVRRASSLVLVSLVACSAPKIPFGNPPQEIAAMLQRSAADWNRGDLQGFMSDYAQDSLTSYMANGHVQYGWQVLYDRYQKNYFAPGKSRDSLSFDELHVRVLTPDFAYATARFKLSRRDSVVASGPFTLVLQKQGDRWKILHDHTSADTK